jgi:hypothetical protein
MLNSFIDPSPAFYLLLLIIGLVLLAAWSRTRKRKYLVLLAADLALAVAVFALDLAFESPREQVVRKIDEAARSIEARDLNKFFGHVSDRFHYGTSDKAKFRSVMEQYRSAGQIQSVRVWDIQVEKYPGQEGNPPDEMTVRFRFKVTGHYGGGPQEGMFTCRTVFVRDPDGEWRLKGFEVYPLVGDQSSVMQVPGL